jgi:hypothetical protein
MAWKRLKMKSFTATPLMKKLMFVAVLLVGAVLWKLGLNYLEQPGEDPYEIEKIEVKPI